MTVPASVPGRAGTRPAVSRTFGLDEVVDVVVIGTGAGGAPLTAVLAAAGRTVVALEAGRHRDPADHTSDEPTAAAAINWLGERLSGGADPTAFGTNNSGRGVGGSLLHWGAFTPRPDHDDLRLRSTTGHGLDWPFGLDELTPYLERVEHVVGVSGPARYPWDPGRVYRFPPAPRNGPATLMARGCEALGIRVADAPAAVLTADRHHDGHPFRHGCVSCGACHQGCRNGAKGGADNTWLPEAVGHGAEIRADSTAVGFERDGTGNITGVVYRTGGEERRQRCAAVVLAAGGVESPRLLLHAGIANSSGQVGRNFMAHGATQVWGRFDQPVRSHRGYPSAVVTEDFRRPSGLPGGYLVQSLGVMPVTWSSSLVRGGGLWGRDLVEAMDGYRMSAGVGINAECLPHEDNLLTLTDQIDDDGVPKVRVDLSYHPEERAVDEHAVATMTAMVEAAGARSTRVLARTAHTLGTCRMGDDPGSSVVDASGRSHDVPNLWICDGSVFPSSLIANPALTIMALSLRTAERVLAA
jgi:choline dehydrogenase-like flavoprotein